MRRLLGAVAATCLLACGGAEVTRYTGSAMNDAMPDSASRLTLTFFSRTDTSFAGVIELGAPLPGTGSVYAWHEGASLKIVTVAAQGGDTIVWTSTRSDSVVGGRFEITGGRHSGQGGTWRARLANGPPANAATLRQPRRLPGAPLAALYPLLIIGMVGLAAGRWVRAAPRAVARDVPTEALATTGTARSLNGFGGWLLLFLVAQCIALIAAVLRIDSILTSYRRSIAIGAVVPGMQALIVLETAIQLLVPAIVLAGIILIVRRSALAPRFWLAYLAISAVYLLLDLAVSSPLSSRLSAIVGQSATEGAGGLTPMIRQALVSLVWALYWAHSLRVRATFGATALDATAQPIARPVAPPLPEVVPPSPVPPRRRRRAVWIAGALGAALAVLIGLDVFALRIHPYAVPAGADVRKFVAGRWDWKSHTKLCGDSAHVIAFPGAGEVMTITQQNRFVDSLGTDRTTTTYDVLRTDSTTIRGAIRGETRRTDDGKPVVWDLVLMGPNEYRWHRTDWWSRGYTAPIVRCDAGTTAAGSGR